MLFVGEQMSLTPLERYQQDLLSDGFIHDSAQEHAVKKLDSLHHQLVLQHQSKNKWQFWRKQWPSIGATPIRGLYFWGGVGRGKTYLMDNFFDSLPFEHKQRVHFHRFMRLVHQELKTLVNVKNPLEVVAERFAKAARVICFDEFFVSDITDAMILAGLFGALFDRGVCLVATSNIVPDQLYKDGLQRQRFLPAIALLNQHTEVVNVDGGVDYRLRQLEQAELYHYPLDDEADVSLKQSFHALVPDQQHIESDVVLTIEGRPIQSLYEAEDVVWFDFAALCDGPRSQNDYIALACEYHAVLLSNVPQMGIKHENQARRFINLVDEFYDRGVKLILSAEVPLAELYDGKKLAFEFQRTTSRLLEMQSRAYLARAHRT